MKVLFGTLWSSLVLAFQAIARNKVRAALTTLGILIGVSAVVAVTTLASSASSQVAGEIDSFAANAMFVTPRMTQSRGVKRASAKLTDADSKAIAREAVSVAGSTPFSQTMGQVVIGDKNVLTDLIGTTLPYFKIRKFDLSHGDTWTELDEALKTKVCILGQTVSEKLFGANDPVGYTVRIGRFPFRIIGLLAPRGTGAFGDDQDDRVLMPIGSFRARVLGTSNSRVDQIMVSATSPETMERAGSQVTSILRAAHHIPEGAEDDFRVESQAELRATTDGIATALSALLLGVAAVSLIVGGVGVMNIMLVSVSERTREIGIRMSIGARENDILLQFLIEAVVLSLVGGLLGLLLGVGGTVGLGRAIGWKVAPSLGSLLLAVGVSGFIGVAFGYFPARRAAKMDPIDALRTE